MPFFSQLLARRRDASVALVVLIVSAGFALATLDLFVVGTGSAAVNMLRQVGLAIGVAVLIAVLGTHSGAHATVDAFDRSWLVIGALAAASALASVAILGVRRSGPDAAPTGATVPIDRRLALAEEA